jgi:hypothetical protein
MGDDRKKPGVAFWLSIVVVGTLAAAVVYQLSFGPMLWLFDSIGHPRWLGTTIARLPDPIEMVSDANPNSATATQVYQKYDSYLLWWRRLAGQNGTMPPIWKPATF